MTPSQHSQHSPVAEILDHKINASIANEDYAILRSLKALHPGENTRHVALLDRTSCPSFPLSGYLHSLGIKVEVAQEPLHELVSWDASSGAGSAAGLPIDFFFGSDRGARTDKGTLVPRINTGCLKFSYDGTEFLVYKVTWNVLLRGQITLFDFVFEDAAKARPDVDEDAKTSTTTFGHDLISDVFRWAGSLKDEMWVFQDGAWSKDKALWSAIRDATWDSIVLEQEFLEGLRRDTRTFFENRKIYKDLGVVWKRGLLLLGPPGNGKTESIKVLLKELGQPALYVKSFTTQDGPELGVRRIFDHARANAPCILVIEDLDSLVQSNVRSFFLNELDGIGQNEGILTIATTNHPERIDDAILNRPSRFDVKYNFALPTEELRRTYALKWLLRITSMTTTEHGASDSTPIVQFEGGTTQLAEEVAKETNDWSFAFLKELFVSFLLRIAHDKARALAGGKDATSPTAKSADTILMEQIRTLSSQIVNIDKKSSQRDGPDEVGAGGAQRNAFARVMRAGSASAKPAVHSGINF